MAERLRARSAKSKALRRDTWKALYSGIHSKMGESRRLAVVDTLFSINAINDMSCVLFIKTHLLAFSG